MTQVAFLRSALFTDLIFQYCPSFLLILGFFFHNELVFLFPFPFSDFPSGSIPIFLLLLHFSYFHSYTYTWILLILQATHGVQICPRELWVCNDWCPPVQGNCALIDHFASWLLDTAPPLLYMEFKNSFSHFSCSWQVGSLPSEQKQYELQLNIIKSIGSQLPTEMAALWAAFILLILTETMSQRNCNQFFSTNKLMNTKLHLSSKYDQNETFK